CLCRRTVVLKPADRVLIHAAASGLGNYLCSLAHRAGAFVLGTVSSLEKQKRALNAGCDAVFGYEDFVEQVKNHTQGHGVDVVYDSVGAATFLDSLRCIKPRGILVLCGQSSGPVAPFDPQWLRTYGSLYLCRPSLKDYLKPRAEYITMASEVFSMLSTGILETPPIAVYDLCEARTAHNRLEQRQRIEKILLRFR
ncbi:MAG: zinc-binding dehydrogenase, partial [Methylococcales bacterium]